MDGVNILETKEIQNNNSDIMCEYVNEYDTKNKFDK